MKILLFVIALLFNTQGEGMSDKSLHKATFAGGCFWCMEPPFEQIKGVVSVLPGYAGGSEDNPTYDEVSSGMTGHREAIQIVYDPSAVTYEELLAVFWQQIDPTDSGGQFADRGKQYGTAIFYHSDEQKEFAFKSKKQLAESDKFDKPIKTEIIAYTNFFKAEEYHNDYYTKNPVHYENYKYGSGRQSFIEKHWKIKSYTSDLKDTLTKIQYEVTQNDGTEPPFNNEYWDNNQKGIYVDIVSGEVLFSSTDKFKSGTGWPSFTKPLVPENITEKKDKRIFMTRVEVRSKKADSHLGHVFNDGPEPAGMRYCINSAALLFISKENLGKEGYEKYKDLFE